MARLEPEAPARNFVAVDLPALVRDAIVARAALAADKRIDLGFARSADVAVRGDPTSLAMLLANLLDNALRYTPEGGRIDVAVDDDGGQAVLAVIDTGPGIPAADRSRVFERFHRGTSASGADAPGGSGLGLVDRAAHRRRARRHGRAGRRPRRPRPRGPRALSRCERILARAFEGQAASPPRIHYGRAAGRQGPAERPTTLWRTARS